MDVGKRQIQTAGRYGLILLVFLTAVIPLVWLVRAGERTAAAAPTFDSQVSYEVQQVADINQIGMPSFPDSLVELDGRLYLEADDGLRGSELWVYDPAVPTATLAAEIWPGPAGSISMDMGVLDGRLYFSAEDGVHGRAFVSVRMAMLSFPASVRSAAIRPPGDRE
jgi:ELWxxDGT repeat protein